MLQIRLEKLAKEFPVVAVLGPRQSGKTTLVKNTFKNKSYFSLEDPDDRELAIKDPRAFLNQNKNGLIIDEIQRVPDLLSYIQGYVDKDNKMGHFIITGSHNYLLLEKVTQTLAGRVAITKLLPLSLEELKSANLLKKDKTPPSFLNNLIIKGFYPRMHTQKINIHEWYSSYISTYLERDVRLIQNISNLNTFQTFIKICAGRSGQLVNFSNMAQECGVTHNTIKSWLSILESSYIIFQLQPYYKNLNKRLIKAPKLYFYDTGLLCSLLNIQNAEQLKTHYARGAIFESFVISELIKIQLQKQPTHNLYFWRDGNGSEVDCILEKVNKTKAIEIKSGTTLNDDFFKGLQYWKNLTKSSSSSYLIYGGEKNQLRTDSKVYGWRDIKQIF